MTFAAAAFSLCNVALASPAEGEGGTLPTVIVTATAEGGGLAGRTATGSNLGISRFATPASVDAVTRTQLEERGDASLVDAITRVAGISAMPHPGNGGSSLTARGFTDAASVMRLYDGMRQYGGAGVTFPFDTWAVERIEVLRGPASVIYGEGAIGGVINVIPKQPTRDAVANEVYVGVGTEATRRAAFGSGGALNDRWSYRVDASVDRSDNWVDRGDSSSRAFSGALRYDVSPELDVKLAFAYGRQKPMRYFGTPLVNGEQSEALRERNYNVGDAVIVYEDRWTDLALNWRPNGATTVRSRFYHVASERHWKNAEAYEYNAATGLIDRSDNTEILHDHTQTGNTTSVTTAGTVFGLRNDVSFGFDVNATSFTHTNNTYVGSSPSVDPYAPVPGVFASAIPTIPRYRAKARQYALFAEDRLQLGGGWSLVGGLRYDHADLERHDLVAGRLAYDKTFADVGWRVGAVYQATPGLALYGQYARAADPIGSLLFLSPANSRFDNPTGRQVEVGVKHAFAQRAGEWTLAVYEIGKKNLLTRDAADPSRSIQVGQRSSRGIEGTVALHWPQGWHVDANASIVRARFDDFSEAAGGALVSRAGNTPTDVPQRQANLWVSRDIGAAWNAAAGVRYVDARYANNANTLRLPSYTTSDLVLRWQPAAATTVTLRGANVFDKRYFVTAYYTPMQWLVGADRRVELAVHHRF